MLTAAEWLSESFQRQELAVMNIPLAMELYAKYRETELSRPPKDVVDEILWKYPIEQEMYKASPTCKYLGEEVLALQEAAKYGYSLASGDKQFLISEIMRLYEFIMPRLTDKELADTIEQLHNFKKERNG